MDKLRFKFVVMGSADGKTNVICINSIETPDGRVFEVPDELKPVHIHTAMLALDVYRKIKNSLKKRHQTRSVWVPLNADLKAIYLDEGENVQFGDQYLDEITGATMSSQINTNSNNVPEGKNLGKTAERFLMEKFSNKTNADQWISEFESECGRFDILQDGEKIEILKHLLEKPCLDWYSSMLIKFTVNSKWALWKDNFCETFGNKGWSQVKYTFTFRYQAGSLLEYATKKERLLLEVNKNIDTQTMIHLIVMGLPDNIIDKIDKEAVKSTASLFNEIGKHEYVSNKNNFIKNKRNSTTYDYKVKTEKIKPCKTCENLNKGVRFHPEERCWFKETEKYSNKRNNGKTVNNSVIDVELNYDDKKKRIITPLIKVELLLDTKLEIFGIYDSGSNVSIINSKLIKLKSQEQGDLKSDNLVTINSVKKTIGLTTIKIKIFDIEKKADVYIIDGEEFKYDFLIGLDIIKQFRLVQDENLKITQKRAEIKIEEEKHPIDEKNNKKNTSKEVKSEETSCSINFNEHVKEEDFKISMSNLNTQEKSEIYKLIDNYKSIFAKDKYDIGTVRDYEARIDLLVEKYCSKRPYRCSVEDKKEIEEQVAKLLDKNLIEESYSPFAAPVTLAFKKEDNRKSRLCIDFRDLNKIVVPQAQPFPLIDDLVIKTRDSTYFTTLDINSAFWSIPLRIEDRKKTAFVTQEGHFQWTCLPFGLKTSPAIFQRILGNILRKYKLTDFAVNYIDDNIS